MSWICVYLIHRKKEKRPLRLAANIRNVGRTNEKNCSQGFKIGGDPRISLSISLCFVAFMTFHGGFYFLFQSNLAFTMQTISWQWSHHFWKAIMLFEGMGGDDDVENWGDAPIRNIDFLNLNLSLHIFFFSSCFLFPSTIDFTICFLLTSKAGDGSWSLTFLLSHHLPLPLNVTWYI